ncbi:hypothetical protein ACFICF_004526 [Salmonella enterica]|jgi:hypothetical protein
MSQFRVMSLAVDGSEAWEDAVSEEHAMKIAKTMRNTRNHMVVIESDGVRLLRWDRTHIRGENRWRRCHTEDVMIIGPVPEMIRVRRDSVKP